MAIVLSEYTVCVCPGKAREYQPLLNDEIESIVAHTFERFAVEKGALLDGMLATRGGAEQAKVMVAHTLRSLLAIDSSQRAGPACICMLC